VAARFVLKKDTAGNFRFNLVVGNGEVIASGEAYTSKASALSGIEAVRRSAAEAEVDDQTD
jgi:uncharacterized protein YegP (UPF0339 family)